MRSFRKGFTLVELLVVIVIIGIMGVMILPNFTTGSEGARLRTASRGIMQMVRYARTMAVLQQAPMDLVFSSTGEVRVERRSGGGGGMSSAAADYQAATADSGIADSDIGEAEDMSGGKGYELADVSASKTYERVTFVVELDERALGEDEQDEQLHTSEAEDGGTKDGDDPLAPAATLSRISFESNGRCLPFVVTIRTGGEESPSEMIVTVDRFGSVKITGDDE